MNAHEQFISLLNSIRPLQESVVALEKRVRELEDRRFVEKLQAVKTLLDLDEKHIRGLD